MNFEILYVTVNLIISILAGFTIYHVWGLLERFTNYQNKNNNEKITYNRQNNSSINSTANDIRDKLLPNTGTNESGFKIKRISNS